MYIMYVILCTMYMYELNVFYMYILVLVNYQNAENGGSLIGCSFCLCTVYMYMYSTCV